MSRSALLLLVVLLAVTSVHAFDIPLSQQAVVDTLFEYGTELNALAEYALGSNCQLSSVNSSALYAASVSFVSKFFSTKIRSYTVSQSTAPFPSVTVLNYSVGGAAQPATGVPAFPTTQSLYNYMPTAYVGFFNYFFSRPFWWIIDKPLVTAINLFDIKYGGAVTAHITASNVNEGYSCIGVGTANVTRQYTKQQSVFHHVLVLEGFGSGASWRFIEFQESNKNQVKFPLPIQLAPAN